MSDLVERLRTRANIRRAIPARKSVIEGKNDRIADLLDEAAAHIRDLEECLARQARRLREHDDEIKSLLQEYRENT